MMPGKAEHGADRSQHSEEEVLQDNAYSQPWWQVGPHDPSTGGKASKSPFAAQMGDSLVNGAAQSEHRDKTVSSSTTLPGGEHLDPNSQMELVGHSIVLTPYAYGGPHYGGVLTSYGQPAMVPPHLYGMYAGGRMPLPLEMEEEPVYVNAKQYHGILRRRQSRAKAELEKKVTKGTKPYLHESRHQHAMRRTRGSGGRFLNTKKLDESGKKNTSSDGNESAQSTNNGNVDSSSSLIDGAGSTVEDVQKTEIFSKGSKNNDGHGLTYNSQFGDGKEADFLGRGRRESMQLNGSAHGAIRIK